MFLEWVSLEKDVITHLSFRPIRAVFLSGRVWYEEYGATPRYSYLGRHSITVVCRAKGVFKSFYSGYTHHFLEIWQDQASMLPAFETSEDLGTAMGGDTNNRTRRDAQQAASEP